MKVIRRAAARAIMKRDLNQLVEEDREAVESLSMSGIRFKHMLEARDAALESGTIDAETTTGTFTFDYLIPLTADSKESYAEYQMRKTTGSNPPAARFHVVHSWTMKLCDLLMCLGEMANSTNSGPTPTTKEEFLDIKWHEAKSPANLNIPFFVCAFVVNQHLSCCPKDCTCQMDKIDIGEPGCLIDKFHLVQHSIWLREGADNPLIVALDKDLKTLQRLCCLEEVVQAVQVGMPIRYVGELPSDARPEASPSKPQMLVDSRTASCHDSKVSTRIKTKIENVFGTYKSFDKIVSASLKKHMKRSGQVITPPPELDTVFQEQRQKMEERLTDLFKRITPSDEMSSEGLRYLCRLVVQSNSNFDGLVKPEELDNITKQVVDSTMSMMKKHQRDKLTLADFKETGIPQEADGNGLEDEITELKQLIQKFDRLKTLESLGGGKGTHFAFIGNPGVGKSTILNGLLMRAAFKSGLKVGPGLTQVLKFFYEGNHCFIDTPGLEDIGIRQKAACEIEKALKENKRYKIIFVVTEQMCRIKPADILTIKTVLNAAPSIKHYGLIFNLLTEPRRQLLEDTHQREVWASLEGLRELPHKIAYMLRDADLEDKSDIVKQMPNEILDFVKDIPGMNIESNKVQALDISFWEKKVEELTQELDEMRKKNELIEQKYAKVERRLQEKEAELEATRQREEANESSPQGSETVEKLIQGLSQTNQKESPVVWVTTHPTSEASLPPVPSLPLSPEATEDAASNQSVSNTGSTIGKRHAEETPGRQNDPDGGYYTPLASPKSKGHLSPEVPPPFPPPFPGVPELKSGDEIDEQLCTPSPRTAKTCSEPAFSATRMASTAHDQDGAAASLSADRQDPRSPALARSQSEPASSKPRPRPPEDPECSPDTNGYGSPERYNGWRRSVLASRPSIGSGSRSLTSGSFSSPLGDEAAGKVQSFSFGPLDAESQSSRADEGQQQRGECVQEPIIDRRRSSSDMGLPSIDTKSSTSLLHKMSASVDDSFSAERSDAGSNAGSNAWTEISGQFQRHPTMSDRDVQSRENSRSMPSRENTIQGLELSLGDEYKAVVPRSYPNTPGSPANKRTAVRLELASDPAIAGLVQSALKPAAEQPVYKNMLRPPESAEPSGQRQLSPAVSERSSSGKLLVGTSTNASNQYHHQRSISAASSCAASPNQPSSLDEAAEVARPIPSAMTKAEVARPIPWPALQRSESRTPPLSEDASPRKVEKSSNMARATDRNHDVLTQAESGQDASLARGSSQPSANPVAIVELILTKGTRQKKIQVPAEKKVKDVVEQYGGPNWEMKRGDRSDEVTLDFSLSMLQVRQMFSEEPIRVYLVEDEWADVP